MEQKFTKGEWHPIQYANYWAIQNVDYYDDKSDLLNEEDMGEVPAKANALLASKAPQLLETLQQCINLIKGGNTDYLSWPDRIISKELMQRAEQLITEATTI